jgi:predicted permease
MYSSLVVLTMALGIGATTTLFGLVQGVLLEPLPWPDSERLVRLSETREGATRQWPWMFTNWAYRAWAESPSTIEGLAGWRTGDATLAGAGEPERLRHAAVTASLFRLLDAEPILGRCFDETEERTGDALLLSERLWERRFERSPEALGRVVRLDGAPYRIVGVMPRGFGFPDPESEAWIPLEVPPGDAPGVTLFSALARLRSGVPPERASLEATTRAGGAAGGKLVELALFGSRGKPRIEAAPLLDSITDEVRPALLLLLAAVGLLLATATANVAGLQLAAATVRRRELALRAAIGAGRGRLARMLLAESLLIALLGGALGLALTAAIQRLLPVLLPDRFPRLEAVSVGWEVAACAVVLSLTTGVGLGALPALFAGRVGTRDVLAELGVGAVGATRSVARSRAGILVAQVGVACLLLLGALQLGRSFHAQLGADRGYDTSDVLVARLHLPDSLYTTERRASLIAGIEQRLAALPGVERTAFANVHPLDNSEAVAAFTLQPQGEGGEARTIHTAVRSVSAGYFDALGLRRVAGRFLDERDVRGAPPAVVVNRTFAERHLEGMAVGSVLPFEIDDTPAWNVVGVVEDARPANLGDPRQPEIFLPSAQREAGLSAVQAVSLLVRTRQPPATLAVTLRTLLLEQDGNLVPGWIRPLHEILGDRLAQPRLRSVVVGAFAGCALVVAGVGLFGVLSYTVSQRRREIGLRVALGARPGDIAGLIGRRALGLTGAGVGLGLALSFAASRVLESLLWGVQAHDASSVALAMGAMAAVALAAAAFPAARAARLDPQQVLREH